MGPTRRTLRPGLLEGGTGQMSENGRSFGNLEVSESGLHQENDDETIWIWPYYMRPLDFGGLPILFKNPKWRKRKNWWSLPVLARCPCVPWALTRLTLHPGMGCREISPASTKCLGRMLSLDSSPLDKAAGFGWLWIIHILFVGCHISNKSMHFEKNSYSSLLYFVFSMVRYVRYRRFQALSSCVLPKADKNYHLPCGARFRDVANTPLWLDSFDLLLCDLDGGSKSTEFARAFGEHKASRVYHV